MCSEYVFCDFVFVYKIELHFYCSEYELKIALNTFKK